MVVSTKIQLKHVYNWIQLYTCITLYIKTVYLLYIENRYGTVVAFNRIGTISVFT